VSKSHLLPQVLREIIIDEALASWEADLPQGKLGEDESEFIRHSQKIAMLPADREMSKAELTALTRRNLKLQKFKEENWGHKLTTHYLARKSELDRVIYSVMRIPNGTIAQEIYFRVQAGEKTLAELAWQYSQGVEAKNGGKIGPVLMNSIQPEIAKQLVYLQPGQLSPLFILDNVYVFVRLEQLIHAQFDDRMKQMLLDELFEQWLKDKIASEIGLVSVETKTIDPDFMHNYDRAIYDGIVSPRELKLSTQVELAEPPGDRDRRDRVQPLSDLHPTPQQEQKIQEPLTLQRGDTGLLIAQLQGIANGGVTATEASRVTHESEDINLPDSEVSTIGAASPQDIPQPLMPIEPKLKSTEPKTNKLLVAFLILAVAIGCGGVSFSVLRSMGLAPIVRLMQK
jgi:hypothetical protein